MRFESFGISMKMFRFSCFPAHSPSHGHKKTVRISSKGLGKGLEDSSLNKPVSNLSGPKEDSMPCFNTVGVRPNKIVESVTDYSPPERECKSDELDGGNCDSMVHKNAPIRKSISLGSVLNWEETSIITDNEQDGIEQRSADHCGTPVAGDTYADALSPSDKCQEAVLSDSLQVGSDVTKNTSIFSIGGPQRIEKEDTDKDGIVSSFVVDYRSPAPHFRAVISRSRSLPRTGSPSQSPVFLLHHSRSADDLNTSDSRKTCVRHDFGRALKFEEGEKIHAVNLADDTDENYNYVDSAKHWIVPEHDGAHMETAIKGDDTSFQPWGEAPTGDFKLKRIEQWVTNLQFTGPLEETEEFALSSDHQESSNYITLLENPVGAKLVVGVTPGAEVAKRYISSLNPSATTAQLSNLGLVVMPFLSAFVSLKALNLSGNSIVRIAAGALPRGLHILNLSKNSISTIEGLRDLTRLRVLDLSYNRILRIGHGLAGCSSLKELYLAGNKISEIEGLHRLLKLNVLDLRFNKISTTKSLDQLAANYNCLHALSLEGNPAQKNVGDEQLKKYILPLLPNLTYYNRKSVKVGTMKDGTDRSARLGMGSHQMDRGARVEVKNMRKGTATTSHRRGQAGSKQVRPPPSGMRTTASQLSIFKSGFSVSRSRSEGNLGDL